MAKKPIKKKAPATSLTLAKLKLEVSKNYVNTERFLIELGPECFNEVMSSPQGFGAHDLKQPYFDLYTYLLGKYKQKLIVKMQGNKRVSLHAKV